nr:hypothetical protein KK1_042182 [Ipomoea batatas]
MALLFPCQFCIKTEGIKILDLKFGLSYNGAVSIKHDKGSSPLFASSNDDDLLSLPNSSDLTAQSGFPSEGPHFDQASEEKSTGPEALEPRSQYPEDELSAEKRSSRLEGAKVFERADRFKELASSFRSCFCWTSKSGKLLSSSVGMSRACNEDRKRLDWRLLPGRCNVGTFCWGQPMFERPLLDGDMGGVNGDGDMTETEEGEPGISPMAAAKSIALAAEVFERGDGTADPVDTYKGLSSSCNEGSIGYSFFSDVEEALSWLNFSLFGDEVDSEADDGDWFPEEGDSGGEFEFELVVSTLSFCSTIESHLSKFSRHNFVARNFGETARTSRGCWPLASANFGSAPASKSSLIASKAFRDPPDAAQ